jgi:hypothetical protein
MNSKTQKAIYRSYWDDGSIFGSPCEVDILSKHVEVIYLCGNIPNDNATCIEETITYNNMEFPVADQRDGEEHDSSMYFTNNETNFINLVEGEGDFNW